MSMPGIRPEWCLYATLCSLLLCGCTLKTESHSSTPSHAASTSKDAHGTAATDGATKPAGMIAAEGSSTVYPICQAFAVKFEKSSNTTVSVSSTGTGSGYKKFALRQIDIWNASRPIAPKEIEELKTKEIGWLELNIAIDGIVIAVNSNNDWCSKLSCAQLKQIWEPDSRVKTWKDLDPAWPAEEILLYGADTESGTFEYFTEVINGKKASINTKYTPSANDNVLVQGIATNRSALGFIPFGYFLENTEKLKALAISGATDESPAADSYIEPTIETILSGEYKPLSRPLFMYVNREALTSRPEVAAFMRFAVSEEAQPLIEKKGFVRITNEVRKEMAAKLEDALAGKQVTGN